MELDLDTKHLLADLIAKPEVVSQMHANLLNSLILKYPYYQPLHLLLAKASVNESNATEMLAMAALYNGGDLSYQIIHHPETLSIEDRVTSPANAEIAIEEQEIVEEISEITTPINDEEIDEEQIYDEISEVENYATDENSIEALNEQEVYDEIAEVDKLDSASTLVNEDQANQNDDLVIENIVATDFFAFEENFTAENHVEVITDKPTVTHPEEYSLEAEAQTVSKYNDDKLPYTFLWWLAKTRKEHEQIFQPYVTQKKTEPSQTGELQQQYVEHIFHLQSPFNETDENNKGPLNRQVVPRGNDIIDSFIKNDPQIKAPKAEQINTENKAKKSAEDHNDLVSETLAAIYIEQMLYHKAIDTYEKLSLKFPEKSRYFADLIQSLEKKI
jgi:hypothetical protein